jgi:hypothetical protein
VRGQDQSSSSHFGYLDLESRFSASHSLRPIRDMLGLTPHVAQNTYDTGRTKQKPAINGHTTRHPGYAFARRRGSTL